MQNTYICCFLIQNRVAHYIWDIFFRFSKSNSDVRVIQDAFLFFFFIKIRVAHYTLDIFFHFFKSKSRAHIIQETYVSVFFHNTNKWCALYTGHFLVFLNQNKIWQYMRDIFLFFFSLKITGSHYTRYIFFALPICALYKIYILFSFSNQN